VRLSVGFCALGLSTRAAFLASVLSCRRSIPRATISAGSRTPLCASRSWSCLSLPWVSSSTVTRISYRRGASGATIAGRSTRSGARTSCPTPIPATAGCATCACGHAASVVGRAAWVAGCGTALIRDGASGRGAISATSTSTARLLRCRARRSRSTWFSSVRCAASMFTAVRWMSPRAIISSTSGNRLAVRIAVIRFPAALSDRCSRSTQNANSDEHASRRCNPRRSTSLRYASSSAVISFEHRTTRSIPSSTRSSSTPSKQTFSMPLL